MNDVVSRPRIIRMWLEDRQKDGERLFSLLDPLRTWTRSPGQAKPVKQAGIDVVGKLLADLLHPIQVCVPSLSAGGCVVTLIHGAHRIDVHLLALCSGSDRKPRLELRPSP